VQEHAFFRREDDDLYCEVGVSFPTLALGGSVKVPTLDAEETITIPEGTASGSNFRLRGKGMPSVTGRGRGDLFVAVKVAIPKKLSREQRKAVEELGKILPTEVEKTPRDEANPQAEKPFFERVKDIFG